MDNLTNARPLSQRAVTSGFRRNASAAAKPQPLSPPLKIILRTSLMSSCASGTLILADSVAHTIGFELSPELSVIALIAGALFGTTLCK